MNATAGVFWGVGFLVGIAGATLVPVDLFPGVRPLLLGVVFLAFGVFGEVRTRRWGFAIVRRLRDARPADGRVDLAVLSGACSEPNLRDPRFTQFVALEDLPGLANPPARVSRTSPPLLGRVVVVSLFLGKDGRSWPDAEIARAHEALTRAGVWLEREAARHGATMNIELADTYFTHDDAVSDEVAIAFQPEGDSVGPFEQDAGVKAFVEVTRAASALGFHDAKALFDGIEGRLDADVVVWLVHPRQAGRSFALPRENQEWQGLSLAVCYPCEASFPEPLTGLARVDPVTVVHELLHLFGATDKYHGFLRGGADGEVTRRDVMRLEETLLAQLRVDPSTARELGWPRARTDHKKTPARLS